MSDTKQTDCQSIQLIEKEYINSMLGIDQLDADPVFVQHENIDHSEAYKKPGIECSIFNITGLNIAVPVSSLREILEQTTLINSHSQAGICAGTINHNNETIDVIDIEYLVMNKNRDCKQKPTSVALLKGSSTGFIYDQRLDKQTIISEQVHWRDANSQRVWLAGTVAQQGLALLDIDGVLRLLPDQC